MIFFDVNSFSVAFFLKFKLQSLHDRIYVSIVFEEVFSIRFVHINSARFLIIDFDLGVDLMT